MYDISIVAILGGRAEGAQAGVIFDMAKNRTGELRRLPGATGRANAASHFLLGTKAPAKIQEVTLMRPIHGNL